jgi:hypothetical protein
MFPPHGFTVSMFPGMATTRQRNAARKNIKKAAAAAKNKQTLKKLPKRTRTALGKQANKVKRQKARAA